MGVDYVTILGDEPVTPIGTGSVLDCFSTNQFKIRQLQVIIEMIKNGEVDNDTTIFFADLWFPGIETLFYIRNITGREFKIAGVFHAGTWDPFDFTSRTGMRNWGQYVEVGWLHGVDVVFVATQWHKDLIIMNSYGLVDDKKIFVTGIPFHAKSLQASYPIPSHKENIVVFPHRLDEEKHPEKFTRLAKKYPQWRFIKTMDECKSREEYFKLLARSKVMISFADQETFGYSTVEAMALGNFVIVPDGLSYRETVPKQYRYLNERDIPDMLEALMADLAIACYPELDKWSVSIKKMVDIMQWKINNAAKRRKDIEDQVTAERARIEAERQLKRQKRADAKAAK
jgi:glycosyltransferase involved in cell wall biosynthesis